MQNSIFLLMSSMIGIGFLTLPAIANTSGIILSVIVILFSSIGSLTGTLLLFKGR